MKNKKTKTSFIIIAILIGTPILLILSGTHRLYEVVILFWILLSLNLLFLIVATISRLSNNILINKVYNYIFNSLYDKKIYLNTENSSTLINSIVSFYEIEKDNIDFRNEKLKLQEAIDSSYELSAVPVLTISVTVMYTISIYSNNTDINLLNYNDYIIFIILDIVLLFTFIYVFTLVYLKMKVSVCSLCLNIIKEYKLDQ